MTDRGTVPLPAAVAAGWVVLARPGPVGGPGRAASPRLTAVPVAVAALVVATVVAVGGLLVSQRVAEQQAVHHVAELTDDLAVSVVQPALTDAVATSPAEARQVLDPLVRHWVSGRGGVTGKGEGGTGGMARVKVWTAGGTVLYSDEPALIGRTFPVDDDFRAALQPPRTEADITDLSRPENSFERGQGKLLEVYRPVWTPDGTPLLFETYFRYDTVSERSSQLWRGFAGVILSSLLALLLLLGAGGALFAARARRAGARNEELLRRALDASGAERRRIAATLHDGVVQQLVAASFTAAGQARRAAGPDGDQQLAADLDAVASAVRGGIAGLRSLLVDIYPPSLHTAGLASALHDLAAAAARGAGPVIRVLVVDDHHLVRAGLISLLEADGGIQVAGQADGGEQAVEVAAATAPDVVLMDLSMPGLDGVAATRLLLAAVPAARVVALTSFSDRQRVTDVLAAGATGYVLKDATPVELLAAVRAAADGHVPLDPRVAAALLPGRGPAPADQLSDREKQVLRLVAAGLANKQIARRLGIAESTVKVHTGNVFRRIGVTDRTSAAVWAKDHL